MTMRFFHFATLLAMCLCVALQAPVFAHGPESHEKESADTAIPVAEPEIAGNAAGQEVATAQLPQEGTPASISTLATNLHPATVHFPIALLLFAALAEAGFAMRGGDRLMGAAEIMGATGGATAAIAALFGWIHTGLWFGGEGTMQLHRWLGTALGVLGPVITWLALARPGSRTGFRVLLAVAALLVLGQGWLGAELGHGAGHLWE